MTNYFVMCARAIVNGAFTPEPGPTQLLLVPEGERPSPKYAAKKPDTWYKKLRAAATWGKDSRNRDLDRGDVLIFVHGYNTDQKIMMDRHAQLKHDLTESGYKGEIVSFDWPSNDMALNYLEDRHDAKKTAMQLVNDGIAVLSARQSSVDCRINIHLLGHSAGAYVIREAFDDADDAILTNNAWTVSQVVFISGDVSADSMTEFNSSSESLYRHCIRLTNYSNLQDSVLKLSNAKRLGTAPRVGRIGLPPNSPRKATNVDCTDYFGMLNSSKAIRAADQVAVIGTFDHSWQIGNRLFARDLFETLRGDLDRVAIPTRAVGDDGRLKLVRPT